VDLIQDLPGQSDDSIIDDIEHINALRPHQVTWYILRLHQGSALFGQQGRMANEFISPAESARRRALIRKAMSFIGYIPRPGGRFVRSAAIFDTYKSVRGGESPLIGIGGSAYSHGWGYFFRNRPSVRNKSSLQGYIESIQRSGFAIEVGLPLDEVELLAGKLVTGIRSKVAVPRPTELTRGYLTEASNILDSLENAGLVEQDSDNFYSLTETGSLFEEEICALFYSRRIRELLSREPMTGLVGIHI
jgi:coproporphyrinogen III oxidase-like Fe-S oxidoreductase